MSDAEVPAEGPGHRREEEGAGSRRSGGFGERIGTLALAILLALGIRSFVVEPFRIPSGSMYPTLLVGDHLFVNKLVYGAKLPGIEARLPALRAPRRGEVVVFTVAVDGRDTYPADLRPGLPREEFVKRIVGIPGDRIDLRGGAVFVNGERVETTDTGERFEDEFGRELDVLEQDIDGRGFRILDDPELPPGDGRFFVEEGRYFMLGDNRDYSMDSRVWGTVRREEIQGPAFLVYWSWEFKGGWLELANPATWWNAHVRWGRVGSRIS